MPGSARSSPTFSAMRVYTVEQATDASAGLCKGEGVRPDDIPVDLTRPLHAGLKVVEWLEERQRTREIPVRAPSGEGVAGGEAGDPSTGQRGGRPAGGRYRDAVPRGDRSSAVHSGDAMERPVPIAGGDHQQGS